MSKNTKNTNTVATATTATASTNNNIMLVSTAQQAQIANTAKAIKQLDCKKLSTEMRELQRANQDITAVAPTTTAQQADLIIDKLTTALATLEDALDKLETEKKAKAEQKEKEKKTPAPTQTKAEKAETKLREALTAESEAELEQLTLQVVNNCYTIKEYLNKIDTKEIIVSTIQRGSVWNNAQIISLYNSLRNNYIIPQLVVCNGQLIDGLQRTTAIQTMIKHLDTAQQEIILSKHINIMSISSDNMSETQFVKQFAKLNSGTQMSKAIIARNELEEKALTAYNKIKSNSTMQLIVNNASKQAINLSKQGQIDTLTMYAIAQYSCPNAISADSKTLKPLIEANVYNDNDINNINANLATMQNIISTLEVARNNKKFIANIYNLNTLSSIYYAICKYADKWQRISANLIKLYTAKNTDGTHKVSVSAQNSKWTETTRSGGTASNYIKQRANILIEAVTAEQREDDLAEIAAKKAEKAEAKKSA